MAIGLVLALAGAAGYGAARQTAAFAIDDVVVRGAPPALAREVSGALAPLEQTNLLTLDGAEVVRRAGAVPRVASVTFDRSFPDTLVVTIRPERAVAVVRRGAHAWLVSSDGRVLAQVARRRAPAVPRVWISRRVPLALGARVADPIARDAISAAAVLRRDTLPVAVRTVSAGRGMLVFTMASGLELRLGDASSLRLKLAVAEELIRALPAPARGGPRYVDLVVPSRPVVGPERPVDQTLNP